MAKEILKSINKIKISINENDQLLWEHQASAKCFNQATEKLREESDRLTKEITRINEEISELEPQVEIAASCYKTHVESLALSNESLVTQRLYNSYLTEKNKKHRDEARRTVDEYFLHIQKSKEKLEETNPAYKALQTKRTELKKCKIRCLDLQQKSLELKRVNKEKMGIRQKLFYSDIVAFAKDWLVYKKYLESVTFINEGKQREYMQKLVDITELLKQKQKGAMVKIPQINFPKSDFQSNTRKEPEKVKEQLHNYLSEIRSLLDKEDSDVSRPSLANNPHAAKGSNLQKLEFNANSSKVRILENKTLTPFQSGVVQSKEDRSKIIGAKLKKVAEAFKRSLSRQSSKKSLSQQSFQGEQLNNSDKFSQQTRTSQELKLDDFDNKLSQQIVSSQEIDFELRDLSQESNVSKMVIKASSEKKHHSGSGATQEFQHLNINDGPGVGNIYFRKEPTAQTQYKSLLKPQDDFGLETLLQDAKMIGKPGEVKTLEKPQILNMPDKTRSSVKGTSQPVNTPLEIPVFRKQFQFSTPSGGPELNNNVLSSTNNAPKQPGRPNDNFTGGSENFMKMGGIPGYNFGNNTQLAQMLNETYDYDEGFKSPEINVSAQEGENTNIPINYEGGFSDQPLFPFSQTGNPFNFK